MKDIGLLLAWLILLFTITNGTSQEHPCPGSKGLFYATNPECLIYYRCENQTKSSGSCLPTQRFDIRALICKQLNEVDCNPEYAGVWKRVYRGYEDGLLPEEELLAKEVPVPEGLGGITEIPGIGGAGNIKEIEGVVPSIGESVAIPDIGGTGGIQEVGGSAELTGPEGIEDIPETGEEEIVPVIGETGSIPEEEGPVEITGQEGEEIIPGTGEEGSAPVIGEAGIIPEEEGPVEITGPEGEEIIPGTVGIPGIEGTPGVGVIPWAGWRPGIGGMPGLGVMGGIPGMGWIPGIGGNGWMPGVGVPIPGGTSSVGWTGVFPGTAPGIAGGEESPETEIIPESEVIPGAGELERMPDSRKVPGARSIAKSSLLVKEVKIKNDAKNEDQGTSIKESGHKEEKIVGGNVASDSKEEVGLITIEEIRDNTEDDDILSGETHRKDEKQLLKEILSQKLEREEDEIIPDHGIFERHWLPEHENLIEKINLIYDIFKNTNKNKIKYEKKEISLNQIKTIKFTNKPKKIKATMSLEKYVYDLNDLFWKKSMLLKVHSVNKQFPVKEIFESKKKRFIREAKETGHVRKRRQQEGFMYWCGSGRFVYAQNNEDGTNLCLQLQDPESIDREGIGSQPDGHTYVGSNMWFHG